MTGVTAWKEPGAVEQNGTSGTWLNLSDLISGDPDTGTQDALIAGATWHTYKVMQLIKGGALTGNDKGLLTSVDFSSPDTWGGASDMWGSSLTVSEVEASSFGFALEYANAAGTSVSNQISATSFGFDLPADAVVTGVETRVTYGSYSGGGGTSGISLTKLEMRVHYTFSPKVTAVGSSVAVAHVRGIEPVEQEKKYRFLVYDSNRSYVGDLTARVQNEPTFKSNINTLHSNMALELAQNDESTETAVDTWVNETPEEIGTEGGEAILFDLAAAIGLGPGTNIDVNNEVDLNVYYGAMHEWVDEAGEPIVTDDGELIMFEEGYPNGRPLFTGYISTWELLFGDGDNLGINLLSHSKELDNIILTTDDTVAMTHGTVPGTGSWGIAGGGPGDLERLAQTFRYTGVTGSRGRLRLYGWPGWAGDIPVSISIHAGTSLTSPTAAIATSTGFIEADPDDFRGATYIDFYFNPTAFTNGSDYTIFIDTDYAKTGGNPTYPANFYMSAASVSNGSFYYNNGASWTDSGNDLWFELYTLGGNTTRTFNSQDPGYILRQLCDFAALQGARINYDNESIELTGTTVSITFTTQTISEAIAGVLKTAPADWYYYYDYGENKLHFHPRPTEPAHYYTKGRDTVKLKIKRSIEQLKNDGIFSGGGNPALLIRKTDQSKINDWRRALFKESDNRVTTQATAELLTQAAIDQYGEPLYSGELMVVRVEDFRLEDVTVGELSGLISWGDLIDALQMQNVSIQYHPDYLGITLDVLTPPVLKRIEDIKRNLAQLEHANDPASPTIT